MIFFGETEEEIIGRIDNSNRSGLFPVLNRGVWHSGIHVFYPEKDTVIKNPVSGKFVAGNFDDSKFWRYMVIKNVIELPDKEEKAIECYNVYSHLGASEELNDFMKEIGSESEIRLTAENLEKVKKMPFYIKAYINLPENTCTDEKNYSIITVDGKEESGYGIFNCKLKKCDIDVFANGEKIGTVNEDNVKKMKYENYENGKYLFSTNGGNIQLESVEGYLKVEDWMVVNDFGNINLLGGTNTDRKDSPEGFVLWQKVGEVCSEMPDEVMFVVSKNEIESFETDNMDISEDELGRLKETIRNVTSNGEEKIVCVPESTEVLFLPDYANMINPSREETFYRIVDENTNSVKVCKVDDNIIEVLKKLYFEYNTIDIVLSPLKRVFDDICEKFNCELIINLKEFIFRSKSEEKEIRRIVNKNNLKCIKYRPLNFSEKYGNFFNAVRLLDGQGNAIGKRQGIANKNFVYVKLHCFEDSKYTISVNEEDLTKDVLNISDKNPLNYYYFQSTQVFQKDDAMADGVYGLPKTETSGKAEGEVEITNIDFLIRQLTEEDNKEKEYLWIPTKAGYIYTLKKNIKVLKIQKKIPQEGEKIEIGETIGWAQSRNKINRNETPAGDYPYYLDYGLFFTEDIRKKKVYLKKVKITGKKEYKKQKLEIETNGTNVFFIPPGATVDCKKIEGHEEYVKIERMTFRVCVYPSHLTDNKLKSDSNIFLYNMKIPISKGKYRDENNSESIKNLVDWYLENHFSDEFKEKAEDSDSNEYYYMDVTKECDSIVRLDDIGTERSNEKGFIQEYYVKDVQYESCSVQDDMEYSEYRDFPLQEEYIDGNTYVRFPKPYDGGYLYVPKDSMEIEIKETLQDILGMTDFNCGTDGMFSRCSPVDRLYFEDGELENCKSVLREQLKNVELDEHISEEEGVFFNFNAGGGEESNSVYSRIYNGYLRRIICKHPIEWDNSENQLTNKAAKYIFERGFDESKDCDIYSELKETQSIGNRENLFYFMSPFYFYNKMIELGLMEYNPYEGMTYKEVYGETEQTELPKIKGENFTEPPYFKIVDTPGFAPVYDENHPNKRPNINGYAPVTGFFNENYLEVERESGNTYREDGYTVFNHGGVDFRGRIGIEIKSLIYGTVLAYGKYSTYGRTIFVCNRERTGVYLLAHLKDFNDVVLNKEEICPGDVVGWVGTSGSADSSGNVDGRYDAHLHVSYFNIGGVMSEDKIKSEIVKKTGDVIEQREFYANMSERNPFYHESKKKPNVKE